MWCESCDRYVYCNLYEVADDDGTYTMYLCEQCAIHYEDCGYDIYLVYEEE